MSLNELNELNEFFSALVSSVKISHIMYYLNSTYCYEFSMVLMLSPELRISAQVLITDGLDYYSLKYGHTLED